MSTCNMGAGERERESNSEIRKIGILILDLLIFTHIHGIGQFI